MPSPPKDRPSGRLGRLLAALRPSRAGPLPVQTGFPTSLADLVVKNHGRLKKHPSPSSNSKRRKRAAAAANASPSPSPSPPTPTSPSSPPPPAPAALSAVSPSADRRPRPDLPPAQQQQPRGGCKGGGGMGLGLGFLAVSSVVSLALLVIWSKKVVAAVTVVSFSLYLLESVRTSSSLPRRRSRPVVIETQTRLSLVEGRGRVSPIREVDAETEPSSRQSCSDSDRASEACSILAAEDEAEESAGVLLDEPGNPKAKAKKNKSWKKLLAGAKKLHRGRRSNKEAAGSSGSSFRSEGDRADDDANAKAAPADPSASRRGAAIQTGGAAEDAAADSSRGSRPNRQGLEEVDPPPVETDASVDDLIGEEGEEEEEQAGIVRFPALVLVAVVLAGLVAGKVLALALTVLCSVFLCSVQRSPCSGGGGCSEGRRLELSVS